MCSPQLVSRRRLAAQACVLLLARPCGRHWYKIFFRAHKGLKCNFNDCLGFICCTTAVLSWVTEQSKGRLRLADVEARFELKTSRIQNRIGSASNTVFVGGSADVDVCTVVIY